jgi:hypothetical protein
MTDESIQTPADPTPETDAPARTEVAEEQPEERDQRRLWKLIGAITFVVIIILILLLLTRCGRGSDGANSGGGKTIIPVTGYEPVPGLVSVWVSEGVAIDKVLSESGVSANSTVDTGGGRFVVEVAKGAESSSAKAIQGVEGVYDAGLVYEQSGDGSSVITP